MAGYLTRTKEGGSVASFIVIGIILVAVVVGGIYIVQKRGQNTQVAGPVTSSSPVVPASSAPGSPTTKPSASTSSSSIPTPPPPTSKPPGVTTTPPPASSTPKITVSPAPVSNRPMPKTGPSDYMPGGLMLAVLVGTAASYVKSRRQLRNV